MGRVGSLELTGRLSVEALSSFVFDRERFDGVSVSEALKPKIEFSYRAIQDLIDRGVPIYGVTTGFGESSRRYVDRHLAEELQKNLIEYLSCGQGREVPLEAVRAMVLIRLNSLAQGISGVSQELIDRLCTLLRHDIIPRVPCEGSLGASGDLVPLAYLGQAVQGYGEVYYRGKPQRAEEVLKTLNLSPYKLKPKEGLAIVNGTSTMAGMALYNLKRADFLVELAETATAWQCLLLNGKLEAFGPFINSVAKTNSGQSRSAERISAVLAAENYTASRGQDIGVTSKTTDGFVQDPYSLRCVPQIMGPIRENIEQAWRTLEHEVNSVTDNPVVDPEGRLEMGGNFYGGYLCQSMDFLKINLAHLADLADRQVLMIVSEKFNRGLPSNLVNTAEIDPSEHFIHHGLKGVHQTVGAITSEVIQRAIPSGIFSRSSESHNQDKVSLGMSAAMSCDEMVGGVYKILSMQLVCLAQALDLKKIELKGVRSAEIYRTVRQSVPFMKSDRGLGREIAELTGALQKMSLRTGL